MKISIIVVTFNAERHIEQTLQSIFSQDIDDYELIIVDGKSDDNTLELVKKYQNSKMVIISEPDYGIYDAMNKGIRIASGDVIAFMNAGDAYYEKIVPDVLELFTDDVDIIVGKAMRTINGIEMGVLFDIQKEDLWQVHVSNIFCHQAMFIRKSMFDKFGLYNYEYPILADYDWNITAFDGGAKIRLLDRFVALYDISGVSSISDVAAECREISIKHDDGTYRRNIDELYDKRLLTRAIENNGLKAEYKKIILYGAGTYGIKFYRILLEHGFEVPFVVDSKKTGTFLDGLEILEADRCKLKEYLDEHVDSAVFIASIKYDDDIRNQLMSQGIPTQRILSLYDSKPY